MATQYYCYQCSNQTQVDFPAFVCHRCRGGFIQEMPPDPIPPPRDPAPVSETPPGPSSSAAPSLSTYMTYGNPTASSSSTANLQHPQASQQAPPQQNRPVGQIFVPAQQYGSFMAGPPAAGQHPAQLVRGQMTITAMPVDHAGMPLGAPVRFGQPMMMQQQQQPGAYLNAYGQPQPHLNSSANPYIGHVQQSMNAGQPRPMSPYSAVFPVAPFQGPQPQLHPNNPNQLQPQQTGMFVFGTPGQQGGAMNVQPQMMQFVGGNDGMANIMQALTNNIDDVITAVLNQMGTQGGPPPITQEDVDRIPSNPVTKEMIAENKTCSICLENFVLGVPFKELSCTHQFHGSCIDRWLLMHGNCPICRMHFGGAGAAAENDDHAMHEVNVTYHIGPMAGVLPGQGGGQGPAQPRFHLPHIQQLFYRPTGMAARPPPNPMQNNAHRTFVFSPSPYATPPQMAMRPQQQQPQQPMFPQNYPRMQYVPVGHAHGQPTNPTADQAGGWTGQMFMSNSPTQNPVFVMEVNVPYDGAQPQHHHQHHHHQHLQQHPHQHPHQHPQQQQQAQAQPQLTASRPRGPPRAAASSGAVRPAPPAGPNLLSNLMTSMAQALVNPSAPQAAGLANANDAGVPDVSQPVAAPGGPSSTNGPRSNEPPRNLQDDLGFD